MVETNTKIESIHNHTAELANGFLSGHNYMENLSEAIFNTFEPDRDIRYADSCTSAKEIMLTHRPKILVNSIFFIPHYDEDIHPATKVALIRYINLAHKGKYFIVAGDKVLYVPERFKDVNEENIKIFVRLTITEDREKGSNALINKVRSWLYGIKLNLSLVY